MSGVVDQWSSVIRPQTSVNKKRGEKASSTPPATEEELSGGGGKVQHPENLVKFLNLYANV